ncbi:MAG: HlyD family efflux transporter periplasmic adaptor subunit [Candidatus Aminicenantes bacterium]|nr:HlyD family efflux transporter periplasmic adaptor subunit [Candidatus Aminicenantes bacterium]
MTTVNRKRIFYGALAVVLLTVVVWLNSRRTTDSLGAVETVMVKPGDFGVEVFAVGEIDSEKSITISSGLKEEGKIVSLIDDGSRVAEGDVLVRLDPTPFEQTVDEFTSKVNEWNALVAAQQQSLEWEKIQADREILTAAYELEVAELELQKKEKGDGPLELSRLQSIMLEENKKFEDMEGYIKDLEELEKKGYSNPLEIEQAKEKVKKLKDASDAATRQFDAFRDYILPTQIRTAKAKVEKSKMIIEQTRKAAGFQIGKAIAELDKSRQEFTTFSQLLEEARAELEKTVIRAPQPGLVVLKEAFRDAEMRKPRVGDSVIQNQPILFLPDITAMMARVLIREVDLHKVDVGKPSEIRVDAYPELVMGGRVSFIGILAERRREVSGGEKYFKVNVSILESDARLRPGMTARVRITAMEKTARALTVPVHAVFEEDGRFFCYSAGPRGIERREVAVGAQSEDLVQIVGGIEAGDFVCLSRPPQRIVRKTKYLEPVRKAN